ncbi:MAG: hypothetical protein AAFY85_04445 [Pseudomonadota bacterium]
MAHVKRLGLILAAGLSIYFAVALVKADWQVLAGLSSVRLAGALVVAVPAYAIASVSLAGAWIVLLRSAGAPLGGQARAYARTQAMKYLPGNVGHIVLRHAAAHKLGAGHQALAIAAIAELALVAAAALLVGLVAAPQLVKLAASVLEPGWLIVAACGVILVVSGVISLARSRLASTLAPLGRLPMGQIVHATGLYTVFFLVCGAIQVWLAHSALSVPLNHAPLIIGAGAAAWLAGFLTPGSPAGLGVREVVLLVLLGPNLGASEAVALAAIYRVSTILGDGLFALSAFVRLSPLPPMNATDPPR